jgi:hypothetical protein
MINARSKLAALAVALALTGAVGGAAAQTSAPAASSKQKAKATKADSASMIAVTVTNKRKAGVAELSFTYAGTAAFRPLLRNLGAGKQGVVMLPRDASCIFDFFIKYDDGETNTVTGVDVCPDGKLNLVD